jgi:hypothetical protein
VARIESAGPGKGTGPGGPGPVAQEPQTTASLHPDGEPEEYTSEYTGFVRADDNDGAVRRVGKVHASRIHPDLAADAGESHIEVCDAHSHEMYVLHTPPYEQDDYGFNECLVPQSERATRPAGPCCRNLRCQAYRVC